MKRYRTNVAFFLLAVYMPVWLLSSFHFHVHPLIDNDVESEQHSSEMDEDGCLLCQFQQIVYEEAPQVVVVVSRHDTKVEFKLTDDVAFWAFEQNILSRAPPVLL